MNAKAHWEDPVPYWLYHKCTHSVYGLNTIDGEGKLLGRFTYDQEGQSFQTFPLPDQVRNGDTYRHIRL